MWRLHVDRRLVTALATALLSGLGCYPRPLEQQGKYLCNADQTCPGDLQCDNGYCCSYDPAVTPQCDSCGAACTDTTRVGSCQQGIWECSSAGRVCTQAMFQKRETCDGEDNDCDGVVDNRPGCGGPFSFYAEPTVAFGAKILAVAYDGGASTCLRDAPGALYLRTDIVATRFAHYSIYPAVYWSGIGNTSHVFWAQSIAGPWDLHMPLTQLGLHLLAEIDAGTGPGVPLWANTGQQPVITLCGPTGWVRYTPTEPWLADERQVYVYDDSLPMQRQDAGFGWVTDVSSGAALDDVLRRVERVEVLLTPYDSSAYFQIDFSHAEFGFQ